MCLVLHIFIHFIFILKKKVSFVGNLIEIVPRVSLVFFNALCECACTNLIWKANFYLISKTDTIL